MSPTIGTSAQIAVNQSVILVEKTQVGEREVLPTGVPIATRLSK